MHNRIKASKQQGIFVATFICNPKKNKQTKISREKQQRAALTLRLACFLNTTETRVYATTTTSNTFTNNNKITTTNSSNKKPAKIIQNKPKRVRKKNIYIIYEIDV